jgi:MSHA biogenesis protein MshI
VAVGLGEDRINVVHLRRNGERSFTLVHCSSHAKDLGDTTTLTRLERELRLSRLPCVVPLQVGEYQLLQVEPPAVAPEEMKAAIRWRIKELIDYSPEEATLDILEIPEDRKTTRNRFVYVACSPNNIIQRYVRAFQAARVPLLAIDIPELAQRNLARLFEPAGRGIALLSFDSKGSLVTVSCAGELYLARRIELTLAQLMAAGDEQRQSMMERLVLELQRSLDNLERQYRSISVAKMLVSPVPDTVPLRDFLGQNLQMPVETLKLHEVIDFSAVSDMDDPARQGEYLPLLGAALRGLLEPAAPTKEEGARAAA